MSQNIGTFEVNSGFIRVTDPCYTPDTWCAGDFEARNGTWNAEIVYSEDNSWGRRVVELHIWHTGIRYARSAHLFKELIIDVGVDSGQCGFFDSEEYKTNQGGDFDDKESFYGKVCALTLQESDPAGVISFGAVSSSGPGDGSYRVSIIESDGKAVAAKVVFIDDSEQEEEEEEEMSDLERHEQGVCDPDCELCKEDTEEEED
jgi:hypothetical protein